MAKKRRPAQAFTKMDLLNEELGKIIVSFGLAMQRADRGHIARTGRFTLSMTTAWELYREWCQRALEAEKA